MRAALWGGILGFLGVALGAFGAHGLKGWLQALPDGAERLAWWQTGAQYQLWHALLLVGIQLLSRGGQERSLRWAAVLAVLGVVLFSGSLYAMTLSGIRAFGMVTPLGGVSLLGAWLCVIVAMRRHT